MILTALCVMVIAVLRLRNVPNWSDKNIRVFPKWKGNSMNSANSENIRNPWSMNGSQFTDPLCYLCLPGTVVASWFLTKEVTGSNPLLLHKYFTNSVDSACTNSFFKKNSISPRSHETGKMGRSLINRIEIFNDISLLHWNLLYILGRKNERLWILLIHCHLLKEFLFVSATEDVHRDSRSELWRHGTENSSGNSLC